MSRRGAGMAKPEVTRRRRSTREHATSSVGIAFGGGGAKGLAHIPMLEVLDELNVRPRMMAGTSIGAIIGVLYASGVSGREIREGVKRILGLPKNLQEAIEKKQFLGWFDLVGLDIGRSNLLNVEKLLAQLEGYIGVSTFEELSIPIKVVAADFWNREEVVFDSGPIIPAIAASFAMPGIFKPVLRDGRVLVDGGSVNPLPYDLLMDACDVVVAVDVIGHRRPKRRLLPSYPEMIFNTFQIASRTILNHKIKAQPPTIYVEPEIVGVRSLEFYKARKIYAQAQPAVEKLRDSLAKRYSTPT